MTHAPVQAVFFWRATMMSTFKAIYGRLPGSTTYTKDYLQPRGDVARALERALGIPTGGDTPVTWKWPGGEDTKGRLKSAPDFKLPAGRMNLRWQTDSAPLPWQLTPHPTEQTPQTMPGVPRLTSEPAANQQLEDLVAENERPWLIAVHLWDDGPVLHARLVLENPKPGREYASWDHLPEKVRHAMATLSKKKPGDVVEFKKGVPVRAGHIVEQLLQAFADNPNVLLVGPPGTGKTVAMDEFRRLFEAGAETATFDPDLLHHAFGTTSLEMTGEPRTRSVVFHPSYTYEDFVMGLLPEPVQGPGGGVTVRPHTGPLLDLAHFASRPGRRALLICDEFNRGSASAIFGDTLALLDRDKRFQPGDDKSGARISTPYYHLQPKTSDDEAIEDTIGLPDSLWILAAMNSADRSVAPLDAALRRRFSIVFVEPSPEVLADHLGVDPDFELHGPETWTTPNHIKALAVQLLRTLNERIESILGRDFLLGQSVFWNIGGDTVDAALNSLAAAIDNQVTGTLALSFVDNDAALAAVLNVTDDDASPAPRAGAWHAPAEAIRQVAAPRLRVARFQEMSGEDLKQALWSIFTAQS